MIDRVSMCSLWHSNVVYFASDDDFQPVENSTMDHLQFLHRMLHAREAMTPKYEGLLQCAKDNDVAAARKLLRTKAGAANVNQREPFWKITALHIAARQDYCPMIELLVEYKAGLEEADNQGDTPLGMAARHGNVAAVKLLLQKGANVQHRNSLRAPNDLTVLHVAAGDAHNSTVRVLLEFKADPTAIAHDGLSVIDYVAERKAFERQPEFDETLSLLRAAAAVSCILPSLASPRLASLMHCA